MIEIEKTLFIPLVVRAQESKRKDALFADERAIAIEQRAQLDASEYTGGNITDHGIIARTVAIDGMVNELLSNAKDCTILNIGCGLDTRGYRLSLPDSAMWYDIDLPDVITLRRGYLQEDRQHVFVSGSVLDDAWIASVRKGSGPVVAILEGLLMYFPEAQVREILSRIGKAFPGATVIFDAVHPAFVGSGVTAKFLWGIADANEISGYASGLRVVDAKLTGDLCKQREGFWFRLMGSSARMRARSQIIQARFE